MYATSTLRLMTVALTMGMLVLCLAEPTVFGDDTSQTGLSIRQRRFVSARMKALEARIAGLAESIQKTDPARAERLAKALEKLRQLSLQQRMDAVAALLDAMDLENATDQQRDILKDIRDVLELLAAEDSETGRLEKKVGLLQKWREEIGKLLEDEADQFRESDKVANQDRALRRLEKQIDGIQKLINRQEQLIAQNQQTRTTDLDALPQVAEKQGQLQQDTVQLADQIAGALPFGENSKADDDTPNEGKPGDEKPSDTKPDDSNPGEGKPGEGKPVEGKPSEHKPGDGKPGDGKPGDQKPGDGKPTDGKPGDDKPGDGKPGDKKPTDGKPGENDPDEPGEKKPEGLKPKDKPKPDDQPDGQQPDDEPGDGSSRPGGRPQSGLPASNQPGAHPLRQAAGHQKNAGRKLNAGRGKAAEEDQQRALRELRRSLEKLESERDRVAELSPEATRDLADRQEGTTRQTQKLGDEIAKAGGLGSKPKQGQPNQGQPDGQPGQKSKNPVQQARNHMQDAQQDLAQQQPRPAGQDQKDAIDDLDKGLQEIDKQLEDLQDQLHKQRVAGLLERYREMLARQKDATRATAVVNERRDEAGHLRRSDLLMIRKLAEEERALRDMAQQSVDEILADGTSTILPRVAERLVDDLARVADRLDQRSTGRDTNIVQTEIEWTLEELIEALQQAQQQGQQGDQKPPDQPGQQPDQQPDDQQQRLVPDKAELKLLRAAQRRVNRLTEAFHDQRGEEPLDELRREELRSIADRQREVGQMTEELVE